MAHRKHVWYEFRSWSLLGEDGVCGMGWKSVVCDVDYGDTLEDAMRRCANLVRRENKGLVRMEIVCKCEGKTYTQGVGM